MLAVADAALAAVSRGDWGAVADLMLPEASLIGVREKDGAVVVRVNSPAQVRALPAQGTMTERGFAGEARIAGHTAVVWLPYDFYKDGAFTHCGVDELLLVQTEQGWKIASFVYSVEQPPACRKHPDGPPAFATNPRH